MAEEKELNASAEEATEVNANETVAEPVKDPVKEAKKADKKDSKPNLFARIGKRIAGFWRECVSELRKVVWMSKTELRKSTILVVVLVVALSIVIGLIDYLFTIAIQGIAGLNLFG